MTQATAPTQGRVRLGLFAVGVAALATVAVATSAEWTDSVTLTPTGPGGGDLVSTSFGVEQRPVADTGAAGAWAGGGAADPATVLPFTSAGLAAGDRTYAGLELRTRAGSLPGRVTLTAPALPAGADAPAVALWDDLHVRVVRLDPAAGCSASSAATGQVLVDGAAASLPAAAPVALAGNSGDAILLCFEVGPEDGPQDPPAAARLTVTWRLQAVSTS